MYLKYVEMQGFKSFPDKTTFKFGKGVTAIVGPNGSGKSNVSDAIRWVLGEISSKSLRGSKMEDVIFSGAQGRSPSSFAEVSICMDNSDGSLSDEHDEVIVTRHYSRSGNSEYYINKKEVRLKDIYELFLDTGIGRDGYSIIGQGQVAEILSTKSDTRREMIDEAAGISKFKHKKHEAEKNLAATADNLVRLNDILGEVSSRVEPARKEAEKTEKYLVLFEEARKLEVSLWMDELDALSGERDKLQSAYDSAKEKLEICDNEINECEVKTEELHNRMQENAVVIEENREGIKNHEHRMNELSERKSVLENDVRHYTDRLEEITAQYNELMASIKADTDKFDEQMAKCTGLEEKKTALETGISEMTAKIDAISSRLFNIEFEIGNAALSKEMDSSEQTDLRLKKAQTEASLEQLLKRIEELSCDTGDEDADSEEKKKAEKISKDISEKNSKIEELQNKIQETEETSSKLDRENNRLTAEINDCLIKKAETTKHIDMLTRMENMLEGYAYSVKAVMQAQKDGRLSGILGPVSKLISTQEKYAVALEVALGAQAQHIVTADEKSAKAAINELKITRAGRATFLPLDNISGRSISVSDIGNKNGYVGIASELVSYDKKYERIVSYLLGRTVIADNIDSAASIARSSGFKYKVVSLDGQVVNAGGSFTGGSVNAKTGMLTRNADIDRLNAQLSKLTDDETALKASIEKIKEDMQTAVAKTAELTEKKVFLQTSVAALTAELTALGATISDGEARKMDRLSEKRNFEAEADDNRREIADIDKKLEELAEKQRSDELLLEKKKSEQNSMQAERDDLQDRIYNAKIELAQVLKDIENTRYSIAAMSQTHDLDVDRMNGLEKQMQELKSKICKITQEAQEAAEEIASGNSHYEQMQQTVKRLDAENLENEKTIAELSSKLKKCYSEKENLVREYTKAESKLENGQTEHDRIIGRMFDIYDLTYTSAGEYRIVIENKTESSKRLSYLKGEIKKLGPIHPDAVAEYVQIKERFDLLNTQIGDINKSKKELEEIIENLNAEMNTRLTEAMSSLNENYSKIFTALFGGGKAHISFADEADIINGDIDIFGQPPGKNVNNIQLLSGGERSLISISLYFALIAVNPTPFCIMDEIESALDDVNVDRFAQYARHFCDKTQFIMITHRRGTMNVADILYGITMQERGISKYLTISVDEVESRLGIDLKGQ